MRLWGIFSLKVFRGGHFFLIAEADRVLALLSDHFDSE